MNTKLSLNKFIPHIAAFIIFLAITFVYFGPLWQGKVLKQHDLNTYTGASKEIIDFRKAYDEEALWTNSMFGGMPAYQISVTHSENLLAYIDHYLFRLRLTRPADYVFLYMIGFFILMLVLGVDPWLSILAAVVYAFSSYYFIILGAGHNTKAHAIGYMAPTLAFVIYTFKYRKYLIGGITFSLFMALELYSNHPQITYYLGFIVLFYGIAEFYGAIKEKEFVHFGKSVGVLVLGLLLAVAVNSGNYWTTMEYSPYTIRGASELSFDHKIKSSGLDRDYATQWSYGKEETLTLLIPNAKGGGSIPIGVYAQKSLDKVSDPRFKQNIASMGAYWGSQPMTSGPVYVGAIVVFLFVFGLFIVKGRLKWALFGVTLLSIFLAWGHNMMWFTDLFFDYMPGYNKFRTVSTILVIAELTMVLLAFITLNNIIKKPEIIKENLKFFIIALGLTGGLSLLFYLMPGFFNYLTDRDIAQLLDLQTKYPQQASVYQQLFDDLVKVRMDIFTTDAIRSFLFIAFGAGLIYVFSIKRFNKNILIVGLALIMLTDIVSVDRRYINDNNYQKKAKAKVPYPKTQANYDIQQDKDPNFRVFNTTISTFNDASTSYYHKSIGGYHGAKLRRYQDVIEHHLSRGNMQVLNMLNTKYFIVAGQGGAPVAQKNTDALGNAWFVMNKQIVANADQEIIYIGRAVEITSLNNNVSFDVYGRPMDKVDTILLTTPIAINYNEQQLAFDISRLPIYGNITYTIGNNPMDTTPNFIDVSNISGGKLFSKQQFKVKIISDFNPQRTAIINKEFAPYLEKNKFNYLPSAKIDLTSYLPNHLTYISHAQSPQLAIFSEIYYDAGWNVYIDGLASEYIRADYLLRAMVIPAGDHKIEWKFEPSSYFIGKKITFISSLLLIILLIGILIWEFKSNKSK